MEAWGKRLSHLEEGKKTPTHIENTWMGENWIYEEVAIYPKELYQRKLKYLAPGAHLSLQKPY